MRIFVAPPCRTAFATSSRTAFRTPCAVESLMAVREPVERIADGDVCMKRRFGGLTDRALQKALQLFAPRNLRAQGFCLLSLEIAASRSTALAPLVVEPLHTANGAADDGAGRQRGEFCFKGESFFTCHGNSFAIVNARIVAYSATQIVEILRCRRCPWSLARSNDGV